MSHQDSPHWQATAMLLGGSIEGVGCPAGPLSHPHTRQPRSLYLLTPASAQGGLRLAAPSLGRHHSGPNPAGPVTTSKMHHADRACTAPPEKNAS